MRHFGSLIVLILLGACANPLNLVTSDRYTQECSEDEDAGELDRAEQACYRALVNVDIGNLGTPLKSLKLYDLARIKIKLKKFDQAEDLLRQSLSLEATVSGLTSTHSGLRLVLLAEALAGEGKWDDGAQYLQSAIPIAPHFTDAQRNYTANIFVSYAQELRSRQKLDLAVEFETIASNLKVRSDGVPGGP